MTALGRYAAVALVFFLAGLLVMYGAVSNVGAGFKSAQTDDALVSRHTVTHTAPIKALDKPELVKRKIIPQSAIRNPQSEILATGTITDDSGTLYVGAELNTETGETRLIEKRPLTEAMRRFEIGLGAGLESGDFAKAVQVRYTVGRFSSLYLTGQTEFFFVDRFENRHPWNVMAFLNLRF